MTDIEDDGGCRGLQKLVVFHVSGDQDIDAGALGILQKKGACAPANSYPAHGFAGRSGCMAKVPDL